MCRLSLSISSCFPVDVDFDANKRIFYAIYTMTKHESLASTICTFKLDDLEEAFSGNFLAKDENTKEWREIQNPKIFDGVRKILDFSNYSTPHRLVCKAFNLIFSSINCQIPRQSKPWVQEIQSFRLNVKNRMSACNSNLFSLYFEVICQSIDRNICFTFSCISDSN